MEPIMQLGQRVRIKVVGHDENAWHTGTCIKARSENWVELDADDPDAPFIYDHSNILAWEPIS